MILAGPLAVALAFSCVLGLAGWACLLAEALRGRRAP